jgi:hypothetical protein
MTLMTEVLKYGAIGIGLAVLAYTAGLVRQELGRRGGPRREAQRLILTVMLFSLAAFGISAFIELGEKSLEAVARAELIKADVRGIAQALDAYLGGKFQASVKSLEEGTPEKNNLIYFTNMLCDQVTELEVLVNTKPAYCVHH